MILLCQKVVDREVFMVSLDKKLTADDLIVEYMIYKVKNG